MGARTRSPSPRAWRPDAFPGDEALFHCAKPSGVPRGPSKLHSISDYLHPHLALGLPAPRLADLRALCAGQDKKGESTLLSRSGWEKGPRCSGAGNLGVLLESDWCVEDILCNPVMFLCALVCGGARWAAVHGVAKSRTRLSDFTFTLVSLAFCRGP